MPECGRQLKMVVLGDENSGKSRFLLRLISQMYYEPQSQFHEPQSQFHDGVTKTITLDNISYPSIIWEFIRNPDDRRIGFDSDLYNLFRPLRYCHAIILTVDLTNRESFDNLNRWIKSIERYKRDDCLVVLAATKADAAVRRVVSSEELQHFVTQNPIINHFDETSARSSMNVEKIFTETVRLVMHQFTLRTNAERLARAPSKQELCNRLERYINRVEQDYTKGFWFFSQSRAINREANCLLAKQLKSELEGTDNSIGSVFCSQHISELRNAAIAQNGLFAKDGYVKRGINSSELSDIFKQAHKFSLLNMV